MKLLLEKGGMYDRGKELTFKHFRDIGFLAAMGKVGKWYCGAQNEINSSYPEYFDI